MGRAGVLEVGVGGEEAVRDGQEGFKEGEVA